MKDLLVCKDVAEIPMDNTTGLIEATLKEKSCIKKMIQLFFGYAIFAEKRMDY